MSGGAPAADSSNNLFVVTGNGSFRCREQPAATTFGDSLLNC